MLWRALEVLDCVES